MRSMQPNWHPDEVELDLYRTGEADQTVADHVVGCDVCVDRVQAAHDLASLLRPELVEVEVPAEQDLALRRMAHRAAARGGRRRIWLVSAMAVAAAAAIVFAVWRVGISDRAPDRSAEVAAAGPRDLNSDGQVDILDAFALARALERGDETKPEWDINGDSVVDDGDVEAIASGVVAIEEASR